MAGCSMNAGRRRKDKKKTRKTRKMRGGNFYGPTGAISPGAMEWGAVSNDAYSSATGANLGPDPGAPAGTGGRRRSRRSKTKGKKKTAGRRRKMKGGAFSPGNVNSASTGVGYSSGGSSWASGSGYPEMTGYAARVGGAPMGADGVRSA